MTCEDEQATAVVTKSITFPKMESARAGVANSFGIDEEPKNWGTKQINTKSVLYCTERTGDCVYRKCMANNNVKKGRAGATHDGVEIRDGKRGTIRVTLISGANQSGKKRLAKATLASVVKEMDKPRLAASVEREISKKNRPAILEGVQK